MSGKKGQSNPRPARNVNPTIMKRDLKERRKKNKNWGGSQGSPYFYAYFRYLLNSPSLSRLLREEKGISLYLERNMSFSLSSRLCLLDTSGRI